MLFCKKCGIQLDDDATFCHACGTTVPKTKSSINAQTNERHPELVEGQTIQRDGPVYGIVNLENLPKGHVIDERYEIIAKLGQGGFGAVYRAFDKKMNVDKAIKIIPEALGNDLRAMQNLRQEAQTMIRLNHNNIVRVYDFHEEGAVKYIDMEFIDGKSLNELLLDFPNQRMPEEKVKKLALQITEGLGYAHAQNVIHRDIKPQNIMLTGDGRIKIMDFGIAETLRTSMSMIQNTGTSGTLMYMSPEQLMGGEIRKTSDIYSLGATLYELLSGHPPFYRGDIQTQIMNKIPAKIANISDGMNDIMQTCLKKDAAGRFPDCEQLTKAITRGHVPLSGSEDKIPRTPVFPKDSGSGGGAGPVPEKSGSPLRSDRQPDGGGSSLQKSKHGFGKWAGIVVAALVVIVLGFGFTQGWFSGGADDGKITMETMKDESWDRLSAIDRERVETLLQKADNLYRQNNLVNPENNNAYDIYKEVLKIHSGNKYALAQLDLIRDDFVKRATPQVERENYTQAESILTAGLGYFPGDPSLSGLKDANTVKRLFSEAKAQFKQNQPGQSLRTIIEIEKINPDHKPGQQLKKEIGNYYLNIGDQKFTQKNYSQSIEQYEKAAALLPAETKIAGKIEKAQREAERQRQLAEQRKREEAARRLKITGEMVFVKGGAFRMGSNDGSSDEKPVHRVTVSDFYIGKYEVTQKQWKAVMGSNPSNWKGDNLPVEKVSWNDVQKFLRKLNAKTTIGAGGGNFRLPTEAEWEYAARGGNKSRGYKYAGSNNAADVAWYDNNSGNKTHPVGQKMANELGLYDMSGNVWEWCADWHDKNYYKNSPANNPKGPSSGSSRVLRGGSCYYESNLARLANRLFILPDYHLNYNGLRIVRTYP